MVLVAGFVMVLLLLNLATLKEVNWDELFSDLSTIGTTYTHLQIKSPVCLRTYEIKRGKIMEFEDVSSIGLASSRLLISFEKLLRSKETSHQNSQNRRSCDDLVHTAPHFTISDTEQTKEFSGKNFFGPKLSSYCV